MLLRRTTCQIRTSIQVLLTFFPRLSPSCAHEYIWTSKKFIFILTPFISSYRLAQIVPITLLPNLWLLFMNQCSPSPIETNPAKGGECRHAKNTEWQNIKPRLLSWCCALSLCSFSSRKCLLPLSRLVIMIIFTFTCPRRNTRWLLYGSRTSFTGRRHDRSHCAGTLTDSRHTHSDTGPSFT